MTESADGSPDEPPATEVGATSTARARKVNSRARGRSVSALLPAFVLVLVLVVLAVSLVRVALSGAPLAITDEHAHYDYTVSLGHDILPYRGQVYSDEVVWEWICGIGHDAGEPVSCGDAMDATILPSGQYATGYIHYPTYYVGASATRSVLEDVFGERRPIDYLRVFSALIMVLGAVSCVWFGLRLGLRRWALVTAASAPVASSMMLFMGTTVNPSSLTILAGALVAGAGLLWVRDGRSFWWLAAAAVFASVCAATISLAVGPFLFAVTAVVVGRWFGWRPLLGGWNPRWWHAGVLAATVLAPVRLWSWVIESRATVGNDVLFAFAEPASFQQVLSGIAEELASFHSPWIEAFVLSTSIESLQPFRDGAAGITVWVGMLMVVALVLAVVGIRLPGGEDTSDSVSDRPRWRDGSFGPTELVGLGTLVTLVLYAPVLRMSNYLTFGFDFGIVSRYSMGLTPVVVLVTLLLVRDRRFAGVSAALSAYVVVAVIGTAAASVA